MLARGWVIALFLLIVPVEAAARSNEPRVPPGTDPGGVALALISAGIDYTLPHIASRLARDGEGELIGWDFADGDALPFAPSEGERPWNGSALASAILAEAPFARLIPVRIASDQPGSLVKALAFVAKTPARAVLVSVVEPGWDRELFRVAVREFSNLLIVMPAHSAPADLENVLTLESTDGAKSSAGAGADAERPPDMAASLRALGVAAEIAASGPALDGAGLKRAVRERLAR